MAEARTREVPPLHLVTDDGVLARPDFPQRADEVLRAGGCRVALHLRGPRTGGRRLYGLAAELAPVARGCGALLLVNDRVDVALAAGADGVQLGRRGIRAMDARVLLGPGRVIGSSVGALEEGRHAVDGSDFLLVGSVYPTPSHPGREGIGPAGLRMLVGLGIPVVGIGGVVPERVAEVGRAGARGVAVLRGVWGAADAVGAVLRYLQAWKDADA
ncbi:MAG TPA: thiamine phosphate synthase [Longimicrobiaceae bacterium]|nr:thiamine phosphate synthase [Longimicrobiaceae bacterium]